MSYYKNCSECRAHPDVVARCHCQQFPTQTPAKSAQKDLEMKQTIERIKNTDSIAYTCIVCAFLTFAEIKNGRPDALLNYLQARSSGELKRAIKRMREMHHNCKEKSDLAATNLASIEIARKELQRRKEATDRRGFYQAQFDYAKEAERA